MKRHITIKNFGQINNVSFDLNKRMYVLIGTQASGKSTISKIVYFCLKIKDYLTEYLIDVTNLQNNHPNEYYNSFLKFLRQKFIATFGTTKHMRTFFIHYTIENEDVNISLGDDGFVYFKFSPNLKNSINRVIMEYSDKFISVNNESLQLFISNVNILKQKLQNEIQTIFYEDRDIIYIPAGRSLLSTLSEKLHTASLMEIDLTMQDFINLIDNTKRKFGSKIPDMIENYLKTVKGQINNSAVDYAYRLIKQILKADYVSENDGEKIYFDKEHWVKLMFSSSGQQEALWILMTLFSLILENKKAFIIIEEPEAHLFPESQKYIAELIALCSNVTKSTIIITTHSPYILTSLNILLYSNKVESKIKNEKVVVPKLCRLSYNLFNAFCISSENSKFKMKSICDDKTNMIETEFIDGVSEITNSDLERLLNMEAENDL